MARFLLWLFNLIFIVLIGWVLSRVLRGLFGPQQNRGTGTQRNAPRPLVRGETARDPVCGMFVSTEVSHRLTRGSETLHFCSRECLERYEKAEHQP